ncbi:augmin complex subunit dgt5 isoform X1 [Anastrepha obliqua]|uniref:augmin complex subunit dgt5 isoform X1 n=2 Tax=Anastrepha obliqua TaxID=95512 RepID=UPI00240A8B79|nr:augmin complex subunit dgt5 isoform X1 [Anastrepha obliqua]
MPFEKDIELFQVWAAKLGCPPNAIPSEEALKSIYKSRQRDLFCNLIKSVRSRQDVQEVRENILIKRLEKLKDQVVPTSARSFLPKEMQTYLKAKELKRNIEDVQMRLDEYRKEHETLAMNIKTKNIQHISLKHKQKTLKSRVNLLEFQSVSLDKKLKQEEKNKQLISVTMPVRLTAKNASEAVAMDGVKQALQDLDDFYTFYINQASSPSSVQQAKDALWSKMRSIFSNIPNFIFFNVIMRLKDEQLQYVMSLINKSNHEESSTHSVSGVGTKEPLSAFEIKLLQTKADLVGMVVKFLSVRKERIILEERFADAYGPFVDELQKKVNLFNANANENINEIISDYLVQYNLRNFSKSQNEFIAQQIDECKSDIDYGAKQLENHEVILGSIKQVYSDINTSINRIQYEMLQLGQIKEKILYSKNMLKRLLDEMQMSTMGSITAPTASGGIRSNFQPTKLKVNNSSSTIGDSFEMGGGDMVFCSTKLDFDSTLMSLNSTSSNITATSHRRSVGSADTTLMPAAAGSNNTEGRFNLPPYSSELSTFAEIPFEKFSCVTKECAYHLSPNPLIVDLRELCSTMQLAPGSLLTASGALQEVRNRIKWADLIAQNSHDLKLDLDLIMVDAQSCRQKIKQHREQIEEMLDKIDVTNINTNRTLHKLSKLYDFILANPLRRYIPSDRKYNNQTYADYEGEFSMYYRMATVGASIK